MAEHEGLQPPEQDLKKREPAASDIAEELKARLERIMSSVDDEYLARNSDGTSVCFVAEDGDFFDVARVSAGWDTTPLGVVMEVDDMPMSGLDEATHTFKFTRYFITFVEGTWGVQKMPLFANIGIDPEIDPESFEDDRAKGETIVTDREVDQLQFRLSRLKPVRSEDVPFY